MKLQPYLTVLLVFAYALADGGAKPWEDPEGWVREHAGARKFREADDETIRARLIEILADPERFNHRNQAEFESALSEISLRERNGWPDFLKQLLIDARKSGDVVRAHVDPLDWQILTVLRRLENKPQPLLIEVEPLPAFEWDFPSLPALQISARRHPEETEDFHFMFGGDYRTGRQARWTILLWNHQGELLDRRMRGGGFGGGWFSMKPLGDQIWQTALLPASFLETPLPSGRYIGCVVYHNREAIAEIRDLGNMVLSYSAPFEFEVIPRKIEASNLPEEEIIKLIHALPGEGRARILSATYTEGAHEFIRPDSPAGMLLKEGWPVVPLLLKHLDDPDLNPTQRAWGFGILHSITSCRNPTEWRGVVGPYVQKTGGFVVEHLVNGKATGGGVGFGGRRSAWGGEIDPDAQKDFLEDLRRLLSTLIVTQEKVE